jgi:hypothetical protein
MSDDSSESPDLEGLFLEALESKTKFRKRSMEELLEESPQEPVDDERQEPLQDQS